ncbi:MAG: hypothetical protein AB2A00_05390 [Myxococcota bacterium]
MHKSALMAAALALAACTGTPGGEGTSSSGGPSVDGGGSSSSGGGGAVGTSLLPRLVGLWSGPATQTPLGDFQMMNVDFRAADEHTLFGRVDLDADNNLRFAFNVETHGGKDVLTYRNGGYFLGILRDTRTELVEHDEASGTWRFCAVSGGCDYLDALYDFDGPDHLVFDVKVRLRNSTSKTQHVLWDAQRVETRELAEPFPVDLTSQGTGNAPFPPMPTLAVTVGWGSALTSEAQVWVLLSTQDCSLGGACNISRSLRAVAPAGATSATLTFEQIHAGSYKVNATLDRNNNMQTTLFPDSGDGVGAPNRAITVNAQGASTASTSILYTLP